MSEKETYRKKHTTLENLPVFFHPWWLDLVSKDSWDVIIEEKGNKITGIFIYTTAKKTLFNMITMPVLTPYLGVFYNYPDNMKYTSRLNFEKKTSESLISKLPKTTYFTLRFQPSYTNWLPFFWRGYNQTTKYTYKITGDRSLDEVLISCKNDVRRKINAAPDLLSITNEGTFDEFYDTLCLTFERQDKKTPYSRELITSILTTSLKNKAGKIYFARGKDDNKIHAVSFLIFDSNCSYLLLAGANPELRNSGAQVVLVYEAIKWSLENQKDFDYEGSMIKGVENFISAFGTIQTPYFKITKHHTKWLPVLQSVNGLVRN